MYEESRLFKIKCMWTDVNELERTNQLHGSISLYFQACLDIKFIGFPSITAILYKSVYLTLKGANS